MVHPLLNKGPSDIFDIELNNVAKKPFDLSLDEPLKSRVLPNLLLIGLHGVYAHPLNFLVAFEDGTYYELHDRHSPLEGHKRNFGPHAHNEILEVDLPEQLVLVSLPDVVHG